MNHENIVYLDLETTGLNNNCIDEILQIAIIDNAENTLLYSYCKPINKTEWRDAERIHNISPIDVADAPTLDQLTPQIITAIQNKIVVIYNADFDCSFIPDLIKYADSIVCCMELFAEEYGEYNDYFESYTWQKLATASSYVRYNLNNAHDALADCLATRAVYNYLTTDNELKKKRNLQVEKLRAKEEKYILDRHLQNIDYYIDEILKESNRYKNNVIEIMSHKVKESIEKYIGHRILNKRDYFYFANSDMSSPNEIISAFNNLDQIIKEAETYNLPVIKTKTIPSKYLNMNNRNEHLFIEEIFDAVYVDYNKGFFHTRKYNKYKFLFINPNPVKTKPKSIKKLPKIDISKLDLPIFYGVKIPIGYMTSSKFDDHRITYELKPCAYLVSKSQTKCTNLYSLTEYDNCKYYYFKCWSEMPKNWSTKTNAIKKYKVPKKLFDALPVVGEVKLYASKMYDVYEIPAQYLPASL